MATRSGKAARVRKCVAAVAVFGVLCGCAMHPPVGGTAIPQVPAGMARVWFYRQDLPYNGLDRPYVRMNGAIVGLAELGGAFYRDVAPGAYYVTADSYRELVNQFPHVDLVAGETAYFQVFEAAESSSQVGSWDDWARPTYYIWLMPAAVAGPAVARSTFYPNGG